jgi:hypothetical protein
MGVYTYICIHTHKYTHIHTCKHIFQEIANILWAFAKLGIRPQDDVMSGISEWACTNMGSFNSQGVIDVCVCVCVCVCLCVCVCACVCVNGRVQTWVASTRKV